MLEANEKEHSESPNPADDFQISHYPLTPPGSPYNYLLTPPESESEGDVLIESFQAKSRNSSYKLQRKSVGTYELQRKSVGTDKLQRKSVNREKLQRKSVNTEKLQRRFRNIDKLQQKSRNTEGKSLKADSLHSYSQRGTSSSKKSSFANPSGRINESNIIGETRRRLSYEQHVAFLANMEELYDKKQNIDETSRKAEEILGTDDRDLFLAFQRLLTSNQNSTPQINGIEVYPWTRDRLNTEHYFAFLSSIKIVSVEKQTRSNAFNRTLIYGRRFYAQAYKRLSHEQLGAFMDNIKDLNTQKQTREATLRKVKKMLGTDKGDLFQSFQILLDGNI